jgi:hypothetical protein
MPNSSYLSAREGEFDEIIKFPATGKSLRGGFNDQNVE